MKIAKRIVLGLLGTAVLTSFILSALNAYSAGPAASHTTVQTDSDIAGQTTLSEETALQTKDEMLSIGTSERHMLYQPQDTESSHAVESTDAVQSEAAPSDAAQSARDKADVSDTAQSARDKADVSDTAQSAQDKADASDTAQSGRTKTASSDSQPDQAEAEKNSDSRKKAAEKKAGSRKKGQAADKGRNTFQTVTEDYFSDALFIGDSRTVGMLQSHLLPQAAYYAKTGIGIGDILSERIVNEGGRMISVKEALSLHAFGKVYIMIGINDIARGDADWFTEQYENILDTVRQTQPEAVVYIQGNIPMSYGTQDLSGALNNKNLSIRNEASRTLADTDHIFYLDIDKIYADANGNLKSNYTTDGLHVSSGYYPLWVDYLLQHAIVR